MSAFIRRYSQLVIYVIKNKFIHIFPRLERKKKISFPESVMIQTSSLCNAKCVMCPYSEMAKKLPQGKMSWQLYKKIIDECSQNNISNIVLYLMNEPLVDSNLIDFLQYAREKNPYARIIISTNASLLNRAKAKEIVKYVDDVKISLQSIKKEEYEKITGLNFDITLSNIDYFLSLVKKSSRKIKIRLIFIKPFHSFEDLKNFAKLKNINNFCEKRNVEYQRQLFFNRTGSVPNYGIFSQISQRRLTLNGCSLSTGSSPLRVMPILFNGDALLCCMDWQREVILGNLNSQSIYEIWNSKLYEEMLDKIYSGEKNKNEFLCNRCISDYNFSFLFYVFFSLIYLSFNRMISYIKGNIDVSESCQ